MRPDKKLFKAVSDKLSLRTPVFVEKDYYAVQVLKALQDLNIDGYTFVFAGGTCLSKAHNKIMRFSEDVDIKFVASEEQKQLSRDKQRRARKEITSKIIEIISSSADFDFVADTRKRNEGRFQNFQIQYPSYYEVPEYVRPYIQLELVDSPLYDGVEKHSISSLLAEEVGQLPEITDVNCVSINSIAAEKLVSLLRRTALVSRKPDSMDDPRLIRHAYDLNLISSIIDTETVSNLASKVIQVDLEQFGSNHQEFVESSYDELLFGLQCILNETRHEERYNNFTGPMVYNSNSPSWDTIKKSLDSLAREVFKF